MKRIFDELIKYPNLIDSVKTIKDKTTKKTLKKQKQKPEDKCIMESKSNRKQRKKVDV